MTPKPEPGQPCPTCGHVAPPDLTAELVPAFWSRVELPDTPPPQLEEPVPFMRGNGRRWDRDTTEGDAA